MEQNLQAVPGGLIDDTEWEFALWYGALPFDGDVTYIRANRLFIARGAEVTQAERQEAARLLLMEEPSEGQNNSGRTE